LNTLVHARFPGALVIAEESTSWPGVSRPIEQGGLGFSMKWNMGWMNDTLAYFTEDPVNRKHHHDKLTFGQLYAYSENFVLPLSHDEVVHGKRALLAKMPGDTWQRFANLRLLFTLMYTMPGRKLLFMGDEFGQAREWCEGHALDWEQLAEPRPGGLQRLVGDLNRLLRAHPPLYHDDFVPRGFAWLDCTRSDESVLAYLRRAGDQQVVVCLNFTPVVREGFCVAVPRAGAYRELLNSDSRHYAGSDLGNAGHLLAAGRGAGAELCLTLPPLAGVILAPLTP
jgi:1,4-alpha-glucan branching enzyme